MENLSTRASKKILVRLNRPFAQTRLLFAKANSIFHRMEPDFPANASAAFFSQLSKSTGPSIRLFLCRAGTLACLTFAVPGANTPLQTQEPTSKPWIAMDYGAFFTASLEVEAANIANKGIAIRLDHGPAGVSKGNEFLLFDTDTLRCAAAWTGMEFIDWR